MCQIISRLYCKTTCKSCTFCMLTICITCRIYRTLCSNAGLYASIYIIIQNNIHPSIGWFNLNLYVMHFMHMVDMQSMQNMTSPVPYFEYSNCSCNRQERGSLLWSAAKHSSDTSTRPVASPSPAPAADWLPPLLQAAAAVNTTAAIFCSILQYATAYSSSIQEIQYFCALPIKMWWEKKLIWK